MKTVLAGRVKYTETKTVMLFFSKGKYFHPQAVL